MKILTGFNIIIGLLILISSNAYATGPRVTSSLFSEAENQIHTVDFPPFVSNEVVQGGVASELVNRALHRAGIDAELRIHPIRQMVLYYLLQENAMAVLSRHTQDLNADKGQLIRVPLLSIHEHEYYYRPNHPDGLDVKAAKGLVFGAHVGEDVSGYQAAGYQVVYGSTMSLLKKLKSGEVDVIRVPAHTMEWLTHRYMKKDKQSFVPVSGKSMDDILYVIFNKKHELGEKAAVTFKKALDAMKSDGSYDEIVQHHLQVGESTRLYNKRLETLK